MITEQEFRENGLSWVKTERDEATGAEIDTLLPTDGFAAYRAEVVLNPDTAGTVSFASMSILDDKGSQLVVLDDEGRPLDQDTVEAIAWEIFEADSELCDAYTQGREPLASESFSPSP